MNGTEPLLSIDECPVVIGPTNTPSNPDGIPDLLPFRLELDLLRGLVVQSAGPQVLSMLSKAYERGSLIGTPLDDTPTGRRYAEDFLEFIVRRVGSLTNLRVLEIGSGRGFLLRMLEVKGAKAIGIEPGVNNESHWKRHGVEVIRDMFPTRQLPGPFDLIVAYGVLEHVEKPYQFLHAIRAHLQAAGHMVLSVPDCQPYIGAGDPSMLLHEHHSYFTDRSLARLITASGFSNTLTSSAGYGGAIYIGASPSESRMLEPPDPGELREARKYVEGVLSLRAATLGRYQALKDAGLQLGIFVPSRAITVLPLDAEVRFFDDDPEHHGKFHPPFRNPIEPRASLIRYPVDELWIMSRTFGEAIRSSLLDEPRLRGLTILTVEELGYFG